MANIGWGKLDKVQNYGFPFDSSDDFTVVDFDDSLQQYKNLMHAAHGMIFTRIDRLLWDLYPMKGTVLMQMRFDGNLGFPGGLLDKEGEQPVEALNREMAEEIMLNLDEFPFTQSEHSISHVNQSKQLVTHFYIKEVSYEQLVSIEKNVLYAKDWGIETLGVVRVPLSTLGDGFRGLPVFLANRFAGNAKEQLIYSIRKCNLLTDDDIQQVMKAHKEYVNTMKY